MLSKICVVRTKPKISARRCNGSPSVSPNVVLIWAIMPYLTWCKTVAAVTLLSIIVQPRALIVLPLFERGGIGTWFALMLLSILALALVSIAGLWRCRWWGFVAYYGYGITSTVLLGSALIPFVVTLAPAEARVEGVIALNAIAMSAVAFLHWRHNKSV